jgi:ParB family chromosome partitioning protein
MISLGVKMNKSKRALGKGLSSLLSVDSNDSENVQSERVVEFRPVEIKIADISVNPFQPRLDFKDSEIEELAESIKKQGLIQPIAVRKKGDSYQVISGERRLRAFKLLKKSDIPVVIIEDVDDTKMLEMALVENIQRENLNDIETALSYQKLLFECGLSHQELSERVGKSRSSITNTLRLLKLPTSLQQLVRDGDITMGHARALLSFSGDERQQEAVAKKIVSEGLSVRAVEKLANPGKTSSKRNTSSKAAPQPEYFTTLVDEWKSISGLPVAIKGAKQSGAGKVEIKFNSEDELRKISELFGALNG